MRQTLLLLLLFLAAPTIGAFHIPYRHLATTWSRKQRHYLPKETLLPTTTNASIFSRLDTLRAAGFSKPNNKMSTSTAVQTSIGFLGHFGLFVLSTVMVSLGKRLFVPPSDEPQQAGILNRCPWPFIFFHDPKQGLKDAPTWVVVLYLILVRATKFVVKTKAV